MTTLREAIELELEDSQIYDSTVLWFKYDALDEAGILDKDIRDLFEVHSVVKKVSVRRMSTNDIQQILRFLACQIDNAGGNAELLDCMSCDSLKIKADVHRFEYMVVDVEFTEQEQVVILKDETAAKLWSKDLIDRETFQLFTSFEKYRSVHKRDVKKLIDKLALSQPEDDTRVSVTIIEDKIEREVSEFDLNYRLT